MGDISLHIIKEESGILLRKHRKLLESTFILRDREEKLYAFVWRESN